MREALERVLGIAGFSTSAFASGEALLESAASVASGAACLVLDVHLPGITGFELQRRLTASGSRRPVIFITAHDEPASRVHAASLGAAAYLTKPFPGKELLRAVQAAVGGSRSNGAREQARTPGREL